MTNKEQDALERIEEALSAYVGAVYGDLWEPDHNNKAEARLNEIAKQLESMS